MTNLRIVIVILETICTKTFKICDSIHTNLELTESFKSHKMYMLWCNGGS